MIGRTILAALMLALVIFLASPEVRAQEEPQSPSDSQPLPPAPPKPAGVAFPSVEETDNNGLQPDSAPLTGVQNPTLGTPEIRHSYWVPGLQFSSNILSNGASNGSGNTGWVANNYFIGNLSLLAAWNNSTLAVNYSGGGFVSTDSAQGSGAYHQLALADTIQTGRWQFVILDQFSHTPQSSFGYGGGTNLGIPGVGGSLGGTTPGLGGNYTPNQSVYGVGPYYSNTGSLQLTYALSPRGSITLSGAYGINSFTQSGNYDTNTTVASVGYNYLLTRSDTIGVIYRFNASQYPGLPQAYGSNSVSIAYGRKITGRIALRLFIGPEITQYRVPIGGSSQNDGFSASANVTYSIRKGSITGNYLHGLSGGSGVLVGSILDSVSGGASHSLGRVWTGGINFGYSRNSPVGGTTATSQPVYTDWFAGANVSRPIGRDFNFALAYTATIGNYGGTGCTSTNCSNSNTFHAITVNFQWHPRPFVLP